MFRIYALNFLLAISAAMGMTLLPIFATENLGMSLFLIGLIEGSSEFISNILKLVSGNLFDKTKNKRFLFVIPAAMSFMAKISLTVMISKYSVLTSKLLERFSNGLFASPRDAYVASNTKNKSFSAAMLVCSKTAGCVLGTSIISLSTLFLGALVDNINTLVLTSCAITFIAVVVATTIKSNIIIINIEEFNFKEFKSSINKVIPVYLMAFTFFLSRFNDGILMLHLKAVGFPEWFYLYTIAFFNIAMFISSPVLGILMDRKYIRTAVFTTLGALFLFNICFYHVEKGNWILAGLGLMFWGIQRAGSQTVFNTLLVTNIEKQFYGTALGTLGIITALGTLLSSVIAGYLSKFGFQTVFAITALVSLVTIAVGWVILNKYICKKEGYVESLAQ